MNRPEGEEAYAQVFQFKSFVPDTVKDKLRDYLYKIAHNFIEAKEYLEILKGIDELSALESDSELIFRIQGMALQSFALAMRRITDKSGQRSLQKFIPAFFNKKYVDVEVKKIQEIYSHYEKYLNKGVAHQDSWSIHQALGNFPDTEIIESDIKHIEDFYYKIVKELCTIYASVEHSKHDYKVELLKLIT